MAYFPNNTAGNILENQCDGCLHYHGIEYCPVHAVQQLFNYDQMEAGQKKLRQAMSILISDNGICNVKKAFSSDGSASALPCMEGMKEWAKKHKVEVL